jgi:hypothetical protein
MPEGHGAGRWVTDTKVIVAIIGSLGTILAAIISGYLARGPITVEDTIQVQETAPATGIVGSVQAGSDQSPPTARSGGTAPAVAALDDSPEGTLTASPVESTATSSAPTVEVATLVRPSPTPPSTPTAGPEILDVRVEAESGCDPRVPPVQKSPSASEEAYWDRVSQALGIDLVTASWPWIPSLPNPSGTYTPSLNTVSVEIIVQSDSDKEWLEISRSLDVAVTPADRSCEHVDGVLLWGCGGTQESRDFSEVGLRSEFEEYTARTEYAEADFFTLEPGEFEKFRIPFRCELPGYYRLSVAIPYRHSGESRVTSVQFDIVCPRSVTIWETMFTDVWQLMNSYQCTWDGQGYSLADGLP